jgi:hypothetical protein
MNLAAFPSGENTSGSMLQLIRLTQDYRLSTTHGAIIATIKCVYFVNLYHKLFSLFFVLGV